MMSDLPQDLLEEILSRVPATTLSRLRSTCKRWNTLVKDRRFTEKHFRKAPKQSQVLMLKEYKVYPMSVNLNINVAPPSIEFKGALGLKESHSNLEEVDIPEVLHCDGLLLCTTKNNRLVVWNPCLGEARWIQPKTGRYSRFFLGYENNKSCHSYKILSCLDLFKPNPMFEIYEFSTDSWRVLADIELNCLIPPNPVSSKGNTFWLASDRKSNNSFILSFDFTTERFKRFCLPQIQNPGRTIMALSTVREERLSVLDLPSLVQQKMDVWVTNEIDTEAALSWSKSFTVDFQNIRCKFIPHIVSFLIDEEKKVVLCCDFNYALSMDMVYTLGVDGEYYTETPYVKHTIKSPLDSPTQWPFIFSYVPSLVHIQQDEEKRTES